MNEYKVSLILTVKNEEKSIPILLNSILKQTRLPDEIVIVDGGSSDNTVAIIREYSDNLPIKLIEEKGANIAKGRNIAIYNSNYPVIAVTDGGCELDQNWIEEITRPFHEIDVDIVSGIYIGRSETDFQKVVMLLLVYNFDKVKMEKFNPSSRSISFRRKVWEEINGYPEWLDYAEDTYFDKKLRKMNKRFYLNKKAVVYWEMRDNISDLFKQYYNYAKFEAIALNYPILYFSRFFIWLILIFLIIFSLFFGYLYMLVLGFVIVSIIISLRVVLKLTKKNLTLKNFVIGLLIYTIFEFALFIGFLVGLFKRMKD